MSPERLRRIEELYHAAREREPRERSGFLAAACSGDAELREEVESLLQQQDDSLLDGNVLDHAGSLLGGQALAPGTQLGPYSVIAQLGAGGMGEVYRARDTRLERDVAIKVLPDLLAQDAEAKARFAREAKLIGALSHPNICALYDIGPDYLVMELVEGPTLAERIAAGPIFLNQALAIARQITEGLEAAHDRGIVHRDLKPTNIKAPTEGTVKILDFGLAVLVKAAAGSIDDPEQSPPRASSLSRAGAIMGTAAYMAPEQARGQAVDKRADIWAFGAVFFEMLTGKRLFGGEATADVLSAVLSKEPEWESAPASLRRLLRACLQKDPKDRLRDIGDVWQLVDSAPAPSPPSSRKKLMWAAALIAGLAILIWGAAYFKRNAAAPETYNLSLAPPAQGGFQGAPALSPDGHHLAFAATTGDFGKTDLWIRDLDSSEAHSLRGTNGAGNPFWSPDNRFIGFTANGKLNKVSLEGGPVVSLCDAYPLARASWSRNDLILFSNGNNGSVLFSVPAAGGAAKAVTELDKARGELGHYTPWFLPDGHRFLYTATSADLKSGLYVGDLNSTERRLLLTVAGPAEYGAPGYLVYTREGTLFAQPFDAANTRLTGKALPMGENLDLSSPEFSTSQSGILAFNSANTENVQLTWFDRSGKILGTLGPPGKWNAPSISPDGKFVAAAASNSLTGSADIALYDLARRTSSRFAVNSYFPVWSPDGTRLAFVKDNFGLGQDTLNQKSIKGTEREDVLDQNRMPSDWSKDGRYMVETADDPTTKTDIWVLPLFGNRRAFAYLKDEFLEGFAKLSPNGHWLAYASNPEKRFEVYVQAFPTPGQRWQVSSEGGNFPAWSRDGKELFFIDPQRRMMAAKINDSNQFEAGDPAPLFDAGTSNGPWFAVSKDGRFLIPYRANAGHAMTVIVNWPAALKK